MATDGETCSEEVGDVDNLSEIFEVNGCCFELFAKVTATLRLIKRKLLSDAQLDSTLDFKLRFDIK